MRVRVVWLMLAIACRQEPAPKPTPTTSSAFVPAANRGLSSTETRVLRLQVSGLHCGCGAQIREALAGVLGVVRVDGDFLAGRIEVEHDPALASQQVILDALDRAGHAATVLDAPFAQAAAR